LYISVSNRMVSLCVRRTDNKAKGEMVLPTVYSWEKEESLVRDAEVIGRYCSAFDILMFILEVAVNSWIGSILSTVCSFRLF